MCPASVVVRVVVMVRGGGYGEGGWVGRGGRVEKEAAVDGPSMCGQSLPLRDWSLITGRGGGGGLQNGRGGGTFSFTPTKRPEKVLGMLKCGYKKCYSVLGGGGG